MKLNGKIANLERKAFAQIRAARTASCGTLNKRLPLLLSRDNKTDLVIEMRYSEGTKNSGGQEVDVEKQRSLLVLEHCWYFM